MYAHVGTAHWKQVRLLLSSQGLETAGGSYRFIWEHAEVPQLEKMKCCLFSQQNQVTVTANFALMFGAEEPLA